MKNEEAAKNNALSVNEAEMKAAVSTAAEQARASERARIAAISASLGADYMADARKTAIDKDLTVEQAKALACDAAVAKVGQLEAQLAEANKKLSVIAAGGVKPLEQAASDDQAVAEAKAEANKKNAAVGANPVAAFDAEIEKALAAQTGKKSKFKAIKAAKAAHPDLYDQWQASKQSGEVESD